jgi:DNA-binding NarL/FixJ family response regulator
LIVDDDAMMRLLIRQTLERSGFVCHEAVNGAAALEQFPVLQPDILLMDVMMPEMDGYEACARLRQRENGAVVPVLMLTGWTIWNRSIAPTKSAPRTSSASRSAGACWGIAHAISCARARRFATSPSIRAASRTLSALPIWAAGSGTGAQRNLLVG